MIYDTIKSRTLIQKGWSCDKKYCVTTTDGTKYLLRVTPYDKSATRKELFDILHEIAKLDIPMCKPVEFGTCDEGVYTIHTWIDGKDAEEVIPFLSQTEQYVLGLKAGEVLKKIHSIPAPPTQEDWHKRFNRKTDLKIQKYNECGVRFDDDDKIIEYLKTNRDIFKDRPQTFQHGDFHIGNMMLENNNLVIIDFDRFDFGDPWEEFNRIVWCAQSAPYFATGMVDSYFDKNIPIEFWQCLAFYIGSNTLSSIYWALDFGQSDLDVMMKQSQDVLSWYDNMQTVVPSWYIKDFYFQYIDDIPCKLKSPFDFSFLSKYGKMFKVFDDQDSGNICFGVKKEGKKYFVKFAGAPSEHGCVSTETAIENLKRTDQIYRDLAHDSLIKLISAEEIGGGFAIVFEWINGECPHPMYPLSRQKFLTLPLATKVKIFEDIMEFQAFVSSKGYVAIDFYLASILYDFENEKTTICDIDFYAKMPYTNEMGRMWGSSRFMSPEEFQKGAIIDEVTNVYTVGATAFALLSDSNKSLEKWPLSKELFNIITKALSDDRKNRQQSINELIEDWRNSR